MAGCESSLISLVLLSLLMIPQGHQRHLVVLTASLVVRPDFLHAVSMLQVLVLVLSPCAKILDHVGDTGINSTEYDLFLLLHANVCVVVYAFDAHSEFSVTREFCKKNVLYKNILLHLKVMPLELCKEDAALYGIVRCHASTTTIIILWVLTLVPQNIEVTDLAKTRS